MSLFLTGTCPHCRQNRMTFTVLGVSTFDSEYTSVIHSFCRNCRGPYAALVRHAGRNVSVMEGNPLENGCEMIGSWPKIEEIEAPEHVPSRLGAIYLEAEDARQRRQLHNAGLAFGKVLDVATKKFAPTLEGTLHHRIQQLGATQAIPQSLADWMMQLKAIRNEATHEEEPLSQDDIDNVAESTRLMLTYLFTMPERVKTLTERPAVTPEV